MKGIPPVNPRATVHNLQPKKREFYTKKDSPDIRRSSLDISRELKPNRGCRGYRYKQAQMKAEQRCSRAKKYIRLNDSMKDYIKAQLWKYESPEQIVGVSKLKGIPIVSVERIYQFIWQDKQDGGLLYKFLRSSNKKRRKRYGSNEKRGQIRNRCWIDERPSIADEKIRIGDFELDTVVGKNHKGF